MAAVPTPTRDSAPASVSHRIGLLQREFTAVLGADTVRSLHAESWTLDLLATLVPPAAFACVFVLLGRPDLGAPATAGLVLLNGWLLTLVGLVAHDLGTHRRRYGRTGSWLHGALAWGLLTVAGTAYTRAHVRHHARLGGPDDPEAYKARLDTPAKRWCFATLPGFLYFTRRAQADGSHAYLDIPASDAPALRRRAVERVVVWAWVAGFAAWAALVDWKQVLLAYGVPVLVVAPALNAIRIVFEHADADDANPYWIGTHYRCGWITRALVLADSGDCHLVHHVFPKIPFYRCPQASRLMRAHFARTGVPERTSFWGLLRGWFVDGHAHRSAWPGGGGASSA